MHQSRTLEVPSLSLNQWIATITTSVVIHVTFIAIPQASPKSTIKPSPVRITTTTAPPPPAPPPLEKAIPKKKPKPTPTPNQIVPDAKTNTPPIQGLTKDSVADQGTFSAPVGNTLMIEDTGKRVAPEDVGALKGDMSAPASLIRESVNTPPYTDQALDASLEGTWVVDVYVELSGSVSSVELRKKIGYGMDERVLEAAKLARFKPRKNRFGAIEAGWAEIKFTLVIP